jgi:TP901 family phage tail tape measure protein
MTALKTMSMYLRAAKTEAEEAGLSTENMANSVSELRDELLALTGGQVDIMSNVDAGEYKSTVEILRELSKVWDKLSDATKTNITELIGGGVRNANIISSLMQNFDIVEDALATSMGSAGSALAENEKYLDSVAGRVAQLKSSLESLSTTVLDSELVKFFVTAADAAVRLLTVISDVAFDNFFTTLSTLAIGGGAFTLFKDLD